MDSPLFYVDPDLVKAVESANSFNWEVPNYANRKGDPEKPGGEAYWNEVIEIVDSSIAVDEQDTSQIVAKIKVVCSPVSSSPNVGAAPKMIWLRWSPEALRDKAHPNFKASNLNLDRMLGLLRACGVDTTAGVNMDAYLNEQGGQKWLVGKRVVGLLHQYWFKTKAGVEKKDQRFEEYAQTS